MDVQGKCESGERHGSGARGCGRGVWVRESVSSTDQGRLQGSVRGLRQRGYVGCTGVV